jgi:hypothetical protein
MTLTKSNQGYYDRIQRAKSWGARAEACAARDWEDDHGQFIFYWIGLSALGGRFDPAALDKGRRDKGHERGLAIRTMIRHGSSGRSASSMETGPSKPRLTR